jgi:hypothetical protein
MENKYQSWLWERLAGQCGRDPLIDLFDQVGDPSAKMTCKGYTGYMPMVGGKWLDHPDHKKPISDLGILAFVLTG